MIIYMIYIYIYLDLSRATCVQSQMHICVTCSESKLYKYTVSIRKVENWETYHWLDNPQKEYSNKMNDINKNI